MKKSVLLFLIIPVMVSCAGAFKQIQTVPSMNAMDETKTCDELKSDIKQSYEDCEQRANAIRAKHGWNAGSVAGSIFFFPMIFALDLSKVDNINYANHVERYNWLVSVAQKNECNIDPYKEIDVNGKIIPARKKGETNPVFAEPPSKQSVEPQTGNASGNDIVEIDGKTYKMVPTEPEACEDFNCPWGKWDPRRDTNPHICCPSVRN